MTTASTEHKRKQELPEKESSKGPSHGKFNSRSAVGIAQEYKTKPRVKTRQVKFCPRCGSTDIYWASGLAHLWSIWECRNCSYRGAFIIEDGKLSRKLQEIYAEKTIRR